MSNLIAWEDVNWALVQERLSRQQNRVYKASMEGNRSKIHAIQLRILGSLDARLMAVRRITTDNRELNTSSKDQVKQLSNDNKMKLVSNLKLDGKASSIRRTYISKLRKNKIRLSNILTIEDRAKQMLAKLALEPEWEAKFEKNSYGFRPGRSHHDAITAIFLALHKKTKYVLKIDVQKCFGQIDHEKLLAKLNTFGLMKSQIAAWLKTGIMVNYADRPDEIFQAMERTPHGEIISPLLANIILHGLEQYINQWHALTRIESRVIMQNQIRQMSVIRYADNFIITVPDKVDIETIQQVTCLWLEKETGLTLSKVKSLVIHSSNGVEFLGFQIISVKQPDGKYKLRIRPSKTSKAKLIQRTRSIIQSNRSASSYLLIQLLSPRIMRWADYFRYYQSQKDFSKLDYLIYNQVRAWVFRRKSKGLRGRTKLKLKYFPNEKQYVFRGKIYRNNWVLTGQTKDKDGKVQENFLPKMSWVKLTQYIKIKENFSPYDGNHLYWAKRTEKYSGYSYRICKLIRRQKGTCARCGKCFTPMDVIETDYIIPHKVRDPDRYYNLQALHKYCHTQKS
jgi:group II intron reverse transcriptase/maturase